MTAEPDFKFCKFCGKKIAKETVTCPYCGGILLNQGLQPPVQPAPNPEQPVPLQGEPEELLVPQVPGAAPEQTIASDKIVGAPGAEAVTGGSMVGTPGYGAGNIPGFQPPVPPPSGIKGALLAIWEDKTKRIIAAVSLVILCLCAGGLFYFFGPTEFHVKRLADNKDSKALVQMVDSRMHSRFFTNVTDKAVRALIKLGHKDDINGLSKLLMDASADLVQKKTVVTAFTDENMVVPYFYEVYLKAEPLRKLLQTNGLKQNPDIFKDKIVADIEAILAQSRANPSIFDQQIDDLQVFNVDNVAAAGAFLNVKGITKLYLMKKYIHDDNNTALVQSLEFFKTQPDANLLVKNRPFFDQVEAALKENKAALDTVTDLNKKLTTLNTQQKVDTEKQAMQGAQAKLANTKHIAYYGIKYFDDNTLYINVVGQGDAVISNPPRSFYNFTRYQNDVVDDGSVNVYNSYSSHDVPQYKIVDMSPYRAVVRKHQLAIDKLYAEENGIKSQIRDAEAKKTGALQTTDKMMENMLITLNRLRAEDILLFSAEKAPVPLFM